MEITPEQFSAWTQVLWGASWKILLVFILIVYRDLVIHTGKAIVDTLVSWIKKK